MSEKALIDVYRKKTGKYLGKRQILSGMDKLTSNIYYYIRWRGEELRFHPNIAEPVKASEVVYI